MASTANAAVPFLLWFFSTMPAGPQADIPDSAALRYGLLVPASGTMTTAWDLPRNPLTDTLLAVSPRAELVRRGFRIFMATPSEAPRFTGNQLTCGNCHLNGGQKERGMPLAGVAHIYPEYNKREGRMFTLEDRIIGCFMRSQHAPGARHRAGRGGSGIRFPTSSDEEVRAVAAYISWLSEGIPADRKIPWRGQNEIPADRRIPLGKLDAKRGRALFLDRCTTCHGADGRGVPIGDKKAAPLWGRGSWNDGAGAARVYTLAGIIRYAMPYLNPGSLTDEEAQHIAAYINSKPRPSYPFKERDYRTEALPPDAVYYGRRR